MNEITIRYLLFSFIFLLFFMQGDLNIGTVLAILTGAILPTTNIKAKVKEKIQKKLF